MWLKFCYCFEETISAAAACSIRVELQSWGKAVQGRRRTLARTNALFIVESAKGPHVKLLARSLSLSLSLSLAFFLSLLLATK